MWGDGKLVHHHCGYPLWVEVLDRLGDRVVVCYRDQPSDGLVVFLCPGCNKPLVLWWEASGRPSRSEGVTVDV